MLNRWTKTLSIEDDKKPSHIHLLPFFFPVNQGHLSYNVCACILSHPPCDPAEWQQLCAVSIYMFIKWFMYFYRTKQICQKNAILNWHLAQRFPHPKPICMCKMCGGGGGCKHLFIEFSFFFRHNKYRIKWFICNNINVKINIMQNISFFLSDTIGILFLFNLCILLLMHYIFAAFPQWRINKGLNSIIKISNN